MNYVLKLTIRGRFVTLTATPTEGHGQRIRLTATPGNLAIWASLRGIPSVLHLLNPLITGNWAGWVAPDHDPIIPSSRLLPGLR